MNDDPLVDDQLNLKLNSDNCISDNATIHQLSHEQQSFNHHSIALKKLSSSKSSNTCANNKDLFKVNRTLGNCSNNRVESSDFWTKEEDERLLYYKCKIKNLSWIKIAEMIPGKSARQCSYRFKKLQSHNQPLLNQEDKLKLISLVDSFGEDFERISMYFLNVCSEDLKKAYYEIVSSRKRSFSSEDDKRILEIYYKHNNISLEELYFLKEKGSEQIKERLVLLLKAKGEDVNYKSKLFDPYLSVVQSTNISDKHEHEQLEPEVSLIAEEAKPSIEVPINPCLILLNIKIQTISKLIRDLIMNLIISSYSESVDSVVGSTYRSLVKDLLIYEQAFMNEKAENSIEREGEEWKILSLENVYAYIFIQRLKIKLLYFLIT